jgi:hypothetical protein
VVLANRYGEYSGVCRLFLLGRNKSVVYLAGVSRGRGSSGGEDAQVRAAYSLASGSACDSASLSNQVDMHDRAAGCIVALKTALAPANCVGVTADKFSIPKVYDLGFPNQSGHELHTGSFVLLVESVSGGEAKVAAWAARAVIPERSIVPNLSLVTGKGNEQVIANMEELKPTLESLLGWTLPGQGRL